MYGNPSRPELQIVNLAKLLILKKFVHDANCLNESSLDEYRPSSTGRNLWLYNPEFICLCTPYGLTDRHTANNKSLTSPPYWLYGSRIQKRWHLGDHRISLSDHLPHQTDQVDVWRSFAAPGIYRLTGYKINSTKWTALVVFLSFLTPFWRDQNGIVLPSRGWILWMMWITYRHPPESPVNLATLVLSRLLVGGW